MIDQTENESWRRYAERVLRAGGYEIEGGVWRKPPKDEHEWLSLDDTDIGTTYGIEFVKNLEHRTLNEEGQ